MQIARTHITTNRRIAMMRLAATAALMTGGCTPANTNDPSDGTPTLPVVVIEPSDTEGCSEHTSNAADGTKTIVEENTPFFFLFRRNNKRFTDPAQYHLMLLDEAPLPDENFRFSYTIHKGVTREQEFNAIVRAIERYFSVCIGVETRETDCLLLTLIQDNHPDLTPSKPETVSMAAGVERLVYNNHSMAELAADMQHNYRIPVLDATGLSGGFDFVIEVSHENSKDPVEMDLALEALGLSLEPARRPVKFLVVSKRADGGQMEPSSSANTPTP